MLYCNSLLYETNKLIDLNRFKKFKVLSDDLNNNFEILFNHQCPEMLYRKVYSGKNLNYLR